MLLREPSSMERTSVSTRERRHRIDAKAVAVVRIQIVNIAYCDYTKRSGA